MAVAETAWETGQPYSSEFANMVYSAFAPLDIPGIPDLSGTEFMMGQLPTEMMATRPLEEHEASPVSIILGAFEAAEDKGDAEAQIEVLRLGLTLLAKWPEYLLMTPTGHPSLAFRTPAEHDTETEAQTQDTPVHKGIDESGLIVSDWPPRRYAEGLRAAGLHRIAQRIEDSARELEIEIQGLDDDRVQGEQEDAHTLHWCPVESKNILTGPDNACPACGSWIGA